MYRFNRDRWLAWTLRATATVAGSVVALIMLFLVFESTSALLHVGPRRLFTDPSWHPAAAADAGSFNLSPILLGTLLTSAGAILPATVIGLMSATFVHFYARPGLARCYRRMVEWLAGVPSVTYGLWGLTVIVPLIGRIEPPGPSLLAGVLILTLMILPTVALLADAAFAAVPRSYLHAAAALGLSRRAMVLYVVTPAARSTLATAVILALTRALGETMAVLMVCGNVVRVPNSLFDPVRTLTATIALEMGYARGDHRSALFVCGLVLLVFTLGLVTAAEVAGRGGVDETD